MADPKTDRRRRVICVGLVVADHVCAPISRFPPAGELVTTPSLTLTIGGCAANVAVDLAKLNIPVSLVGKIGDDVFGRYVREDLERSGVDCAHMSLSQTSQTAGTMVVNVAGEDRRFIHAVGANTELTGEEVSDQLLEQAAIVYVGGFGLNPALSGENVATLFQRAHQKGVTTVLDVVLDDPQIVMEMAALTLPHTDLFLPNTDEARSMTGIDDPALQARHFSELGAKTVIVTCGPDGALLLETGKSVMKVPSHKVVQVDGTGGGDAFVAGYLFGLLREVTPRECLNYGAALGASCVQAAGATTGVFNAEQLQEFVTQYPLETLRVD